MSIHDDHSKIEALDDCSAPRLQSSQTSIQEMPPKNRSTRGHGCCLTCALARMSRVPLSKGWIIGLNVFLTFAELHVSGRFVGIPKKFELSPPAWRAWVVLGSGESSRKETIGGALEADKWIRGGG